MIENKTDFLTLEMYKLYSAYTDFPPSPMICYVDSYNENDIKDLLANGALVKYRHCYEGLNNETFCNKMLGILGRDISVTIRYGNYADPYEYGFGRKTKEVNFAYFITRDFLGDEEKTDYLGNYILKEGEQNKLNISKPAVYSLNDMSGGAIWIGKRGCVTPLHCDNPDSFVYQLTGLKKWTFYPPSCYPFLNAARPYPETYPGFFISMYDLRYETIANANPVTVFTTPGDALYIPSGWFHFVETLEDAIMINHIVINSKITPAFLAKNK